MARHCTRDQLNKNSTLLDRSLKSDHLNKIEQDRLDLQRSLIQTSSQFDQIESEKHGLTIALDELRRKFDVEKQNLLDELDLLRQAKSTFEREKLLRDQELRQIRDRSHVEADELKNSRTKIRALEQQLEKQIIQNKDLNDEARHFKLESNNLKRSLNDHELISRERDRLQDHAAELEKELNTLRQALKSHDTLYNEAQFLRNKLADEKSALMKEVSRLENLTKEYERDLDQLRYTVRERTDALQSKDKELAVLRKKEQSFLHSIETLQNKLDIEATRSKDLDGQLHQLQRQLNIEIQNANTAKRELTEYELRNIRLQEEINIVQREKDHLTGHINELQQKLANEEDLSNGLRIEIEELEDRVKEIDRLKSLEDLIQTQRWDDISQMAQTMQSVSRNMARATSPTSIRKRVELQ
ncbi:unnamed protein product [Rotaria magnacalcarata]|uniref:Uncharacterized protein n=5 Tax=Rotaria magnacalcarata TaxID=392030 RepID=A0A816VBQ2_9BILA|nr:unnamed protein product [Rotaria magnacalcarata]CAF1637005.1 unnamed protein product [Rotaria magnacalcarata]CAF2026099.1 unnamed protein product [Rotaria magnacalcarata]CAF2119043.1 unnamed protein product [Rotaria magnacalcarata]CAF2182464.1 unnamed protein product [Rotaria magnacalcarata]